MGIVFRPGCRADAAGLAPLVEALGYPTPAEELADRIARLADAPAHALIVAEEEGALRGWVHVQEALSLAAGPAALVTGLVVDAAARGRGIGRALMACAEQWARARGLATVRLRSRTRRRATHAFYRRLGYRPVKRQVQFRKDL